MKLFSDKSFGDGFRTGLGQGAAGLVTGAAICVLLVGVEAATRKLAAWATRPEEEDEGDFLSAAMSGNLRPIKRGKKKTKATKVEDNAVAAE